MSYPKVIKFKDGDDLYLRFFLIDSSLNENHWGVTPESIPKNIDTFIGMPLLLTAEFDHPALVSASDLGPNIEYQKRFSIGEIIKVLRDGSKYDGVAKIVDPQAKDAIENNEIPFYVSPQVFRLNRSEPRWASKTWRGVHSAIVDKPAYGRKASISTVCEGSGDKCVPALLSASTDCGFCRKAKLLSLIESAALIPDNQEVELQTENDEKVCEICEEYENKTYDVDDPERPPVPLHVNCRCHLEDLETGEVVQASTAPKGKKIKIANPAKKNNLSKKATDKNSSLAQPKPQTKAVMENPTAPPFNASQFVPKADYEKLSATVSVFEQSNKDMKAQLEKINEERRQEKIEAILSAKIEDEKVRSERVAYFMNAKVDPSVVATAYADMKISKRQDNEGVFEQASKTTDESPVIAKHLAYIERRF